MLWDTTYAVSHWALALLYDPGNAVLYEPIPVSETSAQFSRRSVSPSDVGDFPTQLPLSVLNRSRPFNRQAISLGILKGPKCLRVRCLAPVCVLAICELESSSKGLWRARRSSREQARSCLRRELRAAGSCLAP